MVNKLLRQITQALRDIKAGDVLGVYATIYGVIFIGAFAVIFQKNVLFGVIFIILSPIPILILTIITDVAISGMVRNLESVDIDKRTDQPCFEFRAHPPHEKESNQPRWASINVKNVTPFIIKRCFLTVEDLRQNGKSVLTVKRQRRLLWSSGDGVAERDKEIDITPGEEKVGDVAVSLIKENLFKLETWSGLEIKPKGIYEINISIRGRLSDSPTITTSIFDLEYEGGNIITITEKGQEKWQDKNPTPKKNEKIRKGKYPHVSTNSTT